MSLNTKLLKADRANKLVYSSYEMTLNEKRLLLLAICKLSLDMDAFPLMHVKIEDLRKYLELKGGSLNSNIKETCLKLLKRVVQIEDGRGRWIAHQWVSRCIIDPGLGILEIKLHDDLEPYLLQLNRHYQSISFEHIAKIHKSHAVRLFEILWHKRNELGLPRNKTKIGIEELRKMLGLGKSYPRFVDFRIRVIDPAQKELEKSTPIRFTYETEKVARKIVSITFTVFDNDDYKAEKLPPLTAQMMLELKETENPEERSKIIWSHVSEHLNYKSWHKEYERWLKQGKTPEDIDKSAKWAASWIDRKSKTNKPVESLAGFVRWAVRTGQGLEN